MVHPWWRPLKYEPEELYNEAKEYFDFCDNEDNRYDKWIAGKVRKPKTLSWLCLWLWVAKDYISEKVKDEKFSETIKLIRLQVENDIEEWTLQWVYHATSWIFNLKNNFDRNDKTQVDSTINANMNVNLKDASDDELIAMLK